MYFVRVSGFLGFYINHIRTFEINPEPLNPGKP
jgi:hypothetical protein